MNGMRSVLQTRRGCLTVGAALGAVACGPSRTQTLRQGASMLTVYTFGDSVLDCGRYNAHGVTPGQLLVRNDDRLFPEFRGHDLSTLRPARLEHRAQDGATVRRLPVQAAGLAAPAEGTGVALLTVGGNDLLGGL